MMLSVYSDAFSTILKNKVRFTYCFIKFRITLALVDCASVLDDAINTHG